MGEGVDGYYYIMDYRRGQISAASVPAFIKSTAETDGKLTDVIIEQEPAASGKIVSSYLIGLLAGWPVWAVLPSGDKLTRALPMLAQAEVGRIRLCAGEWNRAFLDEVRAFPSGAHDDMIDSAAHAFNHLTGGGRAGGF
jgi:predicted phage terminase large subunit-like protein